MCWWIGGAFLLYRRADPTYALLACLSLGVVLSAPVIGRDGGARIYAAGFSVMALQAALGANLIFVLLAKLLPREGNFFELFDQHAACIARAARSFIALIQHYDDLAARERHAAEVDDAEHAADRITAEVNRLLGR